MPGIRPFPQGCLARIGNMHRSGDVDVDVDGSMQCGLMGTLQSTVVQDSLITVGYEYVFEFWI